MKYVARLQRVPPPRSQLNNVNIIIIDILDQVNGPVLFALYGPREMPLGNSPPKGFFKKKNNNLYPIICTWLPLEAGGVTHPPSLFHFFFFLIFK